MLFLYIICGYIISFFLNVIIYRFGYEKKLFSFLSKCPSCDNKIGWYNYIPFFGYFVGMGKYNCCDSKKDISILLQPILNVGLYIACFFVFDSEIFRVISCGFVSVMMIVIFVDLKHFIIPDRCHLAILFLGIFAIIFKFTTWENALLGLLIFFVLFYLISIISAKAMGKEALGGGDIKLMGASGFFLGWDLTLCGLLVGCAFGMLLEFILMAIKIRKRGDYLAFGPYLALGMIFSMLCGREIISWYTNMLNSLI